VNLDLPCNDLHKSKAQPQRSRVCCIVDNDEGVRELLHVLCESSGLTAESHDSAESFLRTCDPAKARCLVLDAQLAKMSGLDLLKKLKTEGISLPVIMLSANADTETVVQAMKLGAADFFDKPFDTRLLLKRILDLVEQGETRDVKPAQ
jgi:two-component system, LuxR family, response regulator FixJ